MLLCSYALFKCNARTAGVAALCDCYRRSLKPFVRSIVIKKMKWGLLSILFVLVALASIFFAAKTIYNRNHQSVQGRFFVYEITGDLIAQRPILGHGSQSFKRLYNLNQSEYIRTHNAPMEKMLLADNCYFAFNEFLQILAELENSRVFYCGYRNRSLYENRKEE